WMESIEARMKSAAAALDFEQAQRLRNTLDRGAFAAKPEYEWVDRFERFRFLAVMVSASGNGVRVFVIRGGWIQPLGDLSFDADAAACEAMIESAKSRLEPQAEDLGEAGQENIGVACWHLFHPK